jgi:hypothetical protein
MGTPQRLKPLHSSVSLLARVELVPFPICDSRKPHAGGASFAFRRAICETGLTSDPH